MVLSSVGIPVTWFRRLKIVLGNLGLQYMYVMVYF